MPPRVRRAVTVTLGSVLFVTLLISGTIAATHEARLRPAPSGLRTLSATDTAVRVAWNDVSGGSGYRVSYDTSADLSSPEVATFTDNRGTLTGLRPGKRYFVAVEVVDGSGEPLSPQALPEPARTLFPGGFSFLAPQDVRIVQRGLRALSVRWKPVPDAPGYRIEVNAQGKPKQAKSYWSAKPNLRVTKLKPNTRYRVRVAVAAKPAGEPVQSRVRTVAAKTTSNIAKSYDLRVASFNISGSSADEGRKAAWPTRRAAIAQQLVGQGSQPDRPVDVAGLQEANGSKYPELISTMNAITGPDVHYSEVPADANYTELVYNDKTMDLVDSGAIRFAAQEYAHDGRRDAAWAMLRTKDTKTRVLAISAHLETKAEGIRRSQWNQLISQAPALADGAKIVIVGDFNSTRGAPANPTAAAMLPRMYAAGFGDTLGQRSSASLSTATSRAETTVKANYNSVNFYSGHNDAYGPGGIGQMVDYIFASNDLTVKKWEMVISAAGTRMVGLVPSDHNMIRTVLELPTDPDD